MKIYTLKSNIKKTSVIGLITTLLFSMTSFMFVNAAEENHLEIEEGTSIIYGGTYSGLNKSDEKKLTSVTFPESGVGEIGMGAFGSNKLREVDIKIKAPGKINMESFSHNNLESLKITGELNELKNAFTFNPNLSKIELDVTNNKFTTNEEKNAIYNSEEKKVVLGTRYMSQNFKNDTKTIGERSFEGMGVTSLKIPDSVTKIEQFAFARNELTNVVVPASVTHLESGVFYQNKLTSVTISNGVEVIGPSVFSENELEKVTIPNSVKELGAQSFYSNNLTFLKIPDGVEKIGYLAFGFNNLETVIIPESVTVIYGQAFDHNSKDLVIYGVEGSRAESYANENGYTFKDISEAPEEPGVPEVPEVPEAPEGTPETPDNTTVGQVDLETKVNPGAIKLSVFNDGLSGSETSIDVTKGKMVFENLGSFKYKIEDSRGVKEKPTVKISMTPLVQKDGDSTIDKYVATFKNKNELIVNNGIGSINAGEFDPEVNPIKEETVTLDKLSIDTKNQFIQKGEYAAVITVELESVPTP